MGAAARYDAYKSATSVREMKEKGGWRGDLDFDYRRGYVSVVEGGSSSSSGPPVADVPGSVTRSPSSKSRNTKKGGSTSKPASEGGVLGKRKADGEANEDHKKAKDKKEKKEKK